MSDINEDNFDRAFDLIRPVISGSADVGKTLTQGELEVGALFSLVLFYESPHDVTGYHGLLQALVRSYRPRDVPIRRRQVSILRPPSDTTTPTLT